MGVRVVVGPTLKLGVATYGVPVALAQRQPDRVRDAEVTVRCRALAFGLIAGIATAFGAGRQAARQSAHRRLALVDAKVFRSARRERVIDAGRIEGLTPKHAPTKPEI